MLRQSRERLPKGADGGIQNAELFLISAKTPERLAGKALELAKECRHWNTGQFTEKARETACKAKKAAGFRAAAVASSPQKLSAALTAIAADPQGQTALAKHAAFTGNAESNQRVVFVFPDFQGAALGREADWRQRFWECRAAASEVELHQRSAPAKALRNFEASYAGWRLMQRCNILPSAIIGVGSGELLACAAANAVFRIIESEGLLDNTVAVGDSLQTRLDFAWVHLRPTIADDRFSFQPPAVATVINSGEL